MTGNRYDVIVVGAGFAGLAAATNLHRAGRTVLILEARNRVGGRARSVQTSGGWIDLGATWFWENEPLVKEHIARYGLTVFPQHTEGDAIFEVDEEHCRRLPGNPVDGAAKRFAHGAEGVARHMARELPDGALRLDETVTALTVAEDGVEVSSSTNRFIADHVVAALPPALLAEQIAFTPDLPLPLRQSFEATATWMGSMTKAVAVYEQAEWRDQGLAGAAISHRGLFREFHDHSGPNGSPAAIFAFAPSAAFAASGTAEIETVFRAQLRSLFGDAAANPREILVADWRVEGYTSPLRPATHAGTASYGAPHLRRPIHDRILLASTETAPSFVGHIEGALLAGRDAAQRILDT